MNKKRFMIKLGAALLIVFAFGIGTLGFQAYAAAYQPQPSAAAPGVEPACNSCHDSLYYNYDLGKAYCVGAARTRCVDCHDGDAAALDKTSAHAGMDAHPLRAGDDSRCLSCHQQETHAYVDKFEAIAGVRQINYVTGEDYQFTPQAVSTTFPAVTREVKLFWPAIILLGLAAVLHLVFFFAVSRLIHH